MRVGNRPRQQAAAAQAQVFLQPIASPMILGLYSFAAALAVVGPNMAGWYGSRSTPQLLFPFVALFGGIAQFIAAMWGYRARDGLATGVFGLWGSFWASYGLLYALFGAGVLVEPAGPFPELAIWFMVLAWITVVAAWAAASVSWTLTAAFALVVPGSALSAAGLFSASSGLIVAAGWIYVFAAIIAWYAASSMLLETVFGHQILPAFKTPTARSKPKVVVGLGEPGVRPG